jgi:hypothetical protein
MVLRRRDAVVEDEAVVEREEHVWGSPPVVRGLTTLIGVAAAGFLVWLATQFDLGSTGEYWSAMGILAAAGVCLGISQLIGGWTKWGAPTISPGVFLLAFLPTLIAVGGILVATRPTGTEEGEDVAGWIQDIGLGGVAEDLILFQGVLAFGLGIVFAFMFDTRGPRTRVVEEREAIVPDEDVHDYRDDGEIVTDDETVVREGTAPAATVREERTIVEERDTRS